MITVQWFPSRPILSMSFHVVCQIIDYRRIQSRGPGSLRTLGSARRGCMLSVLSRAPVYWRRLGTAAVPKFGRLCAVHTSHTRMARPWSDATGSPDKDLLLGHLHFLYRSFLRHCITISPASPSAAASNITSTPSPTNSSLTSHFSAALFLYRVQVPLTTARRRHTPYSSSANSYAATHYRTATIALNTGTLQANVTEDSRQLDGFLQ